MPQRGHTDQSYFTHLSLVTRHSSLVTCHSSLISFHSILAVTHHSSLTRLIFAINFPLFRVAKGSEILQGTLGKNKINWLKMLGCQEN